jgi:hypothetical protein
VALGYVFIYIGRAPAVACTRGRIHHLVLQVKLTNYHLDYIRRYTRSHILITNISFNIDDQTKPGPFGITAIELCV